MTLLSIAAAVGILILLIAAGRVPPFVAFIISALAAALMLGLPLEQIPKSIEIGIGGMLGPLSIIIVLGAMFGKLIADSGAAERISQSLIRLFGERRIPLAMALTGFIVGIPLFYNVGFVLMVPLIFSVVYRSKLPALYVGIPMLAGLSISHGFLPPHPSPAALVNQFGADMGVTLLYGLLVGVPTLLIAGPVFALSLRKVEVTWPSFFKPTELSEANLPSTANSFICALLPVFLIASATVLSYADLAPRTRAVVTFIGDPMIGLLLSLAIGTWTLGVARGMPMKQLMTGYGEAVRDIAAILLIIAGAGALKQIFVDSGANNDLGALLANLPIHPLVLGWLVALVIRIALGSATVAGLTAAGIVAPLVQATGVDPNWMVLAVGAGSLMCSHINDSGFWMCKEYFNLSLADTFRSWSVMETIVGSVGLVLILLFSPWL
ncbi:permease DsdX [Steroidobacter sp. S1-65]|uniref:Permease DsdX n=1 Tax=Steroidobacter gossypii TaxID=2805490 RepID=A0ABS1X0W1_9GAMM|nr:gluconate:H+ symporter [Steroidobacter gossypii]MBM0106812.1 permease DsdX [Steroidobacter gossypii]